MQIVGLGLWPRAAFTNLANNKKELGDMYIDDKLNFYLDLENKGEIESRYYLQPSESLFSNCLKFS